MRAFMTNERGTIVHLGDYPPEILEYVIDEHIHNGLWLVEGVPSKETKARFVGKD